MASKFTSINGGASTGAAVALALVQPQGPATTSIKGLARIQRNPASDPDAERMEKCRRDLIAEGRTAGVEWWPTGITSTNAVVNDIKDHGVPDALANMKLPRDADTLDFVFHAKNSGWKHGQIAACIGRTEQASRLILHHAKRERQSAAAQTAAQNTGTTQSSRHQRGLDFMRQIIRYQLGDPEPVSPCSVTAQAVEGTQPPDGMAGVDARLQAAAATTVAIANGAADIVDGAAAAVATVQATADAATTDSRQSERKVAAVEEAIEAGYRYALDEMEIGQ